jgi:hypothetical protein
MAGDGNANCEERSWRNNGLSLLNTKVDIGLESVIPDTILCIGLLWR